MEEEIEEQAISELKPQVDKLKQEAAAEHSKGQFDQAISIYQKAIKKVESLQGSVSILTNNLVTMKAAIWNNITACYKQQEQLKKQVEFATKVIDVKDQLTDQNIYSKAIYRRGMAYEQ